MSLDLEAILTNYLESYLQTCFYSLPAIVVGVKDQEELRVDVKILTNHEYKDGSELEYATIYSVPCIMPSTPNSSITFPVVIGTTVLLVFSQVDIQKFKLGTTTPHSTMTNRWSDINDAVAIIGLNPFNKSPNKKTNRKLPHNPEDFVMAHNIGTSLESEVRIKSDGSVHINAPSGLFINGQPYIAHTHTYVADGATLITTPVNGV